jgi:hypothetical protein
MAIYQAPKPERPRLDVPMKPLFIPLKAEYFEAFKRGEKDTEFRKSGGRWNPRTCPIGRDVILSKGYGKKDRLRGYIIGNSDAPVFYLAPKDKAAFIACYGLKESRVFMIHIELDQQP